MTHPLPATIIGGYLGAGKTTLVNHLLRHADGQRLAILVNEFGSLPIDEDLIEASSDDMISISGGCICCSFGSDLTEALIALSNLSPPPDHVIIESSGVAMPGAIATSLLILEGYVLSGIVVLADALHVRTQAQDEYLSDTILRQLKDAHIILHTKTDMVSEMAAQDQKNWLRQVNKTAPVVDVHQGSVPSALILGMHDTSIRLIISPHSDADYESCSFIPGAVVNVAALARDIAEGGHGIIRAKGFVSDTMGQSKLIQIVGQIFEVSDDPANHSPGLVCIGRTGQLDVLGLSQLLAAK